MSSHHVPALRADLQTMLSFFEHQFDCVVGCGCWWDSGWDDEDRVRTFAREGFGAWADGPSIDDVLAAFDRSASRVDERALPAVKEVMDLHFDAAPDFHRFFAKAHRVLAAALRPAGREGDDE